MEDERIAIVRRGLAAWSQGDPAGAVEMFQPEASWHLSGIFPDFTGSLRGRQAILDMWRSFTDPWERIELEPERFHANGDWLLVEVRFVAIGRDGVTVELPQVHAARFEDDLIAEYRSFRELDDALAAIGAS